MVFKENLRLRFYATAAALLLSVPLTLNAQTPPAKVNIEGLVKDVFIAIEKDCDAYGKVLANARFSKLKKKGIDAGAVLGPEIYAKVLSAYKQQCSSVSVIVWIQELKKEQPLDAETLLKLDKTIAEHQEFIEKTL